jgi:hypothetical protein
MKITNKTGLPQPIVDAVIGENNWTRGSADISVTELISPIRQVALRIHHENDIVEDASDRLFALMGQIGHSILEKASGSAVFPEKRFHMNLANWELSGKVDALYLEELFDEEGNKLGVYGIDDYKFTSAYVAKPRKPGERSRLDDWFLQLNLYRMLALHNGFDINRLRLILLLRDWSILAAKRDPDFPQQQVVVIDVPIMDLSTLKKWAFSKIENHMAAQQGMDQYGQSHLPECTDEERWAKPETYAVMKEGRKSALRVLPSQAEAERWQLINLNATSVPGISIVRRPGQNVRCENYCEVSQWCSQWKTLQDEQS